MDGLRIERLSKSYGGVSALQDVSLRLAPGEIHALCGENGAGKSTLNKILSGSVSPDSGAAFWGETPIELGSVRAAEAAGIAIVHQESTAFADLDAVDNIFLGREVGRAGGWWLDRSAMRQRAVELLKSLGESFPVDRPLAELSLAQRQMVGIARALAAECRLLILDEPTASLSTRETEALFGAIRGLKAQGVTVLYVSHRLEEIFSLADRVSVLRDGRHVATQAIAETSHEELVRLMVGRDLASDPGAREERAPGEARLSVCRLTRKGAFGEISLEVRAGEVVVLAGLVGAGRSELARAIFGIDPYDSGEVLLENGLRLPSGAPPESITHGLAFVPEDRQHEGLHLPLPVRENLSLAALREFSRVGFVRRGAERERAEEARTELGIKAATLEAPVQSLSGGNQQKVLLGKWLETKPRILILDEPTRGVDVGAKAEIHRRIRALADGGMAILVISSELPEVLSLADRVLVMRQGALVGELSGADVSQESILRLALPQADLSPAQDIAPRKPARRELSIAALLALVLIGVGIVNPAFLAADNLRDMLVKIAPAVIVGSGLTFVILAREIDISVGSLMGLCSATLGIACAADRMALPAFAGVAICMAVGAAAGFLNGLLVAVGRVPSIIVTLGTLTVFSGVTELLLGGKWITQMPAGLRSFGTGSLAGVPYSVLVAALVAGATAAVSLRTAFGRRVFALGSNPDAAQTIGLSAPRLKLGIFTLTGLLVAVASLFSATQLQVIEAGFGKGFELVAVAAVVVGGTSIRGGRGSILGTVLGAALLGILGTALIFLKLGDSSIYWERAIQGAVILVAVVGDSVLARRRRAA